MINYRQMDYDVAFELGAGKGENFYDSVYWRANVDEFENFNFYNWGGPNPCKRGEDKWYYQFYGSLKEGIFDADINFKLAYVRGRLSNYSVKVGPTSINITYANSIGSRDRWFKFVDEVLGAKFAGKETWMLSRGELHPGSIPMCNFVTLTTSENVIRWLTGHERI